MRKEAFLVSEVGTLVASLLSCHYPKGRRVSYSFQRCREALNASRDWNLVNAKNGKISYARKYLSEWVKSETQYFATEINPGEFYIEYGETSEK